VLEREEETEEMEEKTQELINKIEEHSKEPMKTFNTKETPGSNNAQGKGNCVELGAHGYEVEPRDFVDEDGIVMEPLFNVQQPLSTYAPR
jgi:hypothetical protein